MVPGMISHLKAAFIHIANDIRVIHTGRVVLHILSQHKDVYKRQGEGSEEDVEKIKQMIR